MIVLFLHIEYFIYVIHPGFRKIYPYLQALSFFEKINKISYNFVQKYKDNNRNPNIQRQFYSFSDFIEYFKEYNFVSVDKQRKEQTELFVKNPEKIYYFFLDELHKIFNDNHVENGCDAVEYDKQKAKKLFKDFAKNDRSDISDLFFGEKRIEKICENCKLKSYVYKYLKAIPLDIEEVEGGCSLEVLIKSIQKRFKKKLFCSMCSNMQNHDIKIKITKKPKILIIIILKLHKNIIINIPNFLYNKSYRLICAEICKEKANFKNNIFCCLCTSCRRNNKKKYKIVYNNDNNDFFDKDILNNYVPYVLFYKRNNEKKEDEDEEETDDDIDNVKNLISSDKSINGKKVINNKMPNNEVNNINNNFINNNNQIINVNSNMNLLNNNFMNNNNIFMNNNNNFMNNMNFMNNNNMNFMNNNNMNNNMNDNMNNNNVNNNLIDNMNTDNDKNNLILYFRFKNGKEIFIDTNENETFSNIVVQIKMKYEWTIEMINDNNLYYNKKKINQNKTPKQLNIPPSPRTSAP